MGILGRGSTQKSGLEEITQTPPTGAAPGRGRWSTAFLIAASAIVGATAVAFWNRRVIAKMRVQLLAESEHPQPPAHSDEEIF